MKLDSQTYGFEFITPAWAGGATPAEAAEVRIASIRGQLRQWLRLLYPGESADTAIFGRIAGEGREAQAAASRLLLQLTKSVQSSVTKDLVGYTGKQNVDEAIRDPEAYFLWPLRTQSRGILMPGQSSNFTVTARWYPVPSTHTQTQTQTFKDRLSFAMRAFSILGAIGTRASRGYGGVWEKGKDFKNPAELSTALEFLPDSVNVRLLEGEFADHRQALSAAARWMRSFRVGSQTYGPTTPEAVNDHDVGDPAQARRNNATVYRHALGMPLAQRFNRGQYDTTTTQSKHRHDSQPTDRYPSPLRIKIIRMNGKRHILVVLLRDLLLPEGTEIYLSNGRATGFGNRSARLSHQLVNQMMASGSGVH